MKITEWIILHLTVIGFKLWIKNSFFKYCCLCEKKFFCLGCHTQNNHRVEDWKIIWNYFKK